MKNLGVFLKIFVLTIYTMLVACGSDGGADGGNVDTALFITTWKTDNPGESAANEIAIATDLELLYNYQVD